MSKLGIAAVIVTGVAAGAILGQMYGRASFSGIDDAIACAVIADAIEVGAIPKADVGMATARLAEGSGLDDEQKRAVTQSVECVTRALNKKHAMYRDGGK